MNELDNVVLLIGSRALSIYVDNIKPNDTDLVMTNDTLRKFIRDADKSGWQSYYPISNGKKFLINHKNGEKTEIEIVYDVTQSGYSLLQYCVTDKNSLIHTGYKNWVYVTPSLDVLCTLKMSHRFLRNSPHFLKTMKDIKTMRKTGAKIFCNAWLKLREDETYYYKHPNLDQGSDTFFEKQEQFYKYNHDDIHVAVSYPTPPMYIKILADDCPVKCSKKKFDNLPYEEKLLLGYEESCVLTLERYLIPNNFENVDPYTGFKIALMKVCTSITSGYFREFCWENYYEILSMYNENFVKQFHQFLKDGKIREFVRI